MKMIYRKLTMTLGLCLSPRLSIGNQGKLHCALLARVMTMMLMFLGMNVMAQDILVNVSTKGTNLLPPQVLLYVNDPSQFFTVQLTNTTSEAQRVHLALSLEHTMPNDGLMVTTPEKYQPTRPFTVPANGVYSLALSDMKNLFNHIPSSAMKIPDGLIEGYTNGSFGLLPEGKYMVKFTAYRWTGNNLDTPYPLSTPTSGQCSFDVYYNASAPTWTQPVVGFDDMEVKEVKRALPMFTWTPATITANPSQQFNYTVRIVEVLQNQNPTVAIDHNAVVYSTTSPLTSPMLTIPKSVVDQLSSEKTYAAQITAKALTSSKTNYVLIANNGKSSLCLFKLKDETPQGNKYKVSGGDISASTDSLFDNTPYVFRNPKIISPAFEEGKTRKRYIENNIDVETSGVWYEGGLAFEPDTITVDYTFELYNGKKKADRKEIMTTENIVYKRTIREETTDSIQWDSIAKKVSVSDHMVLRVVPSCPFHSSEEVVFTNDSINVIDFAFCDFIGADYFRCSNLVEVKNTTPTTKKKDDLKDKEVTLGQYKLTIDEIESGSGEKGFKGKGRVAWTLEKLGLGTAMVHVQFDALKINTDDVVYEGSAKAYKDPAADDKLKAVDSLFNLIGLNDLVSDSKIPYASSITTKGENILANNVNNIADYYVAVTDVQNIWNILIKGDKSDVYLPICMPKAVDDAVGGLPVDIQINTMEFAPTYATMDLIGEYVMPDCENISSDMLVFGAPRLCISPDHLLPESGQLALLKDFEVVEPGSGYECTFKAPEDLLEPADGCYVSWKDYKFEVMGIDVDMKIPKLKKYDTESKAVTDELPELTIAAQIHSLDNFIIDEITMDPFEVDALPGYTFQVEKMSYDHSIDDNATAMADYKFPDKYKKDEGMGKEHPEYGDKRWQGFFVEKLSIMLPEGLTSTDDESTERLSIAAEDFLIDRSGVTIDCKVEELFSGSAGGFSLDIQEIGLQFVQNNFDNCYFNGNLGLPLLKDKDDNNAKVGFNCQVRKQLNDEMRETDNFALVFNTQQINGDYNLDLYAARLVLEENQTYFLLESEPEKANEKKSATNKMKTRCELMLGGRMEIGRKSEAESAIKDKLGFEIGLPDVHFVGMRIANCKEWKSKYVKLQANIDSLRHVQDSVAIAGLYLGGKEIANKDSTFFFHTGSWSLASMSKKLGPFEFTLKNYDFDTNFSGGNLVVGLGLCGRIDIIKGIDLGAQAGVTIYGSIKNIDIKNLDNLECSLDSARLDSISVHASFSGVEIDGNMYFENDAKSDKGKGFDASFSVTLPGKLFTLSASGAYYEKEGDTDDDNYTWGYLNLKMIGLKIELGPVVITGLGGGFYFNCSPVGKNDKGDFTKTDVQNKNGLVGMSIFMSMASTDEKAVTGSLDLAVVYNKKLKCLSNFVMTGNVKAVGGIINADLSLVYECTETEKYLQLNITADAKLDYDASDYIGDLTGGLTSIKSKLDEISGTEFNILDGCKQGLDSKIGAKAEEPKGDEKPKEEPKENKADEAAKTEEQKKMAATCSATVTLDVKVTWRSGGVDYAKPKWHFYLGEPAEDKRCSVVLIDFGKEGDMVHCKLGANAYLCFGNELPDNGQLPPIPTKITEFLDGSSKGEGVVSDNVDKAIEARNAALNSFKTDGAGVMLGAQVYGGLGIDLGLIYGSMEAIAGFDVAVTHYSQGLCVNLGKKPGYNGWYGRGQLYAYLAMELGVRFNLGFVSYDIPIVDAGVGGVLSFGGPSPFYFQGKVRAKLELLGGLFKIDKSYKFDVGQQCTLFHGNALDNFMLFSDCSLGDTIKSKGWADSDNTIDAQEFVDYNVRTPQYINTEAPLGEHFRLIDENELDRITTNAQITQGTDAYNKFYMQACRTFQFKSSCPDIANDWLAGDSRYSKYKNSKYALLYEYDKSADDTYPDYKVVSSKGRFDERFDYGQSAAYLIPFSDNGTSVHHYLDLPMLRKALKPGKFYRLMVIGEAKELHQGIWKDPWTCDTVTSECNYVPWSRTVNFYFRTKKAVVVDDKAPLSEYVAIAYPSNSNVLTNENISDNSSSQMSDYMPAYLSDVKAPTIALNSDVRQVAFKKGSLYWRLLNPMGKQIDIAKNAFVEYKNGGTVVGVNMEPQRLLNAQPNQKYILELDYFTEETTVNESGANVSELVDTCLMRLFVETLPADKDWRSGNKDKTKTVKYDQPFMATKLVDYKMDNAPYSKKPTDADLLKSGEYLYDPFWYIGWNSNFAFPGGWEITECNFFGIEVTTSESVIFQGNNGKYEGAYNQMPEHSYSAYNDYETIRDKVIYKLDNSYAMVYTPSDQWPLSYAAGEGNSCAYSYDDRIFPYYQTGTFDKTKISSNATLLFSSIGHVYDAAEQFCKNVNSVAYDFGTIHRGVENYPNGNKEQQLKTYLKNWYVGHRGQYVTDAYSSNGFSSATNTVTNSGQTIATTNSTLSVPAYMFPTIWSVTRLEPDGEAFKGMSGSCDRAENAHLIWGYMSGTYYTKFLSRSGNHYVYDVYESPLTQRVFDAKTAKSRFKEATVVCYRVNAYDFNNGRYGVTSLLNGSPAFMATVKNPLSGASSSNFVDGGYNDFGVSVGVSSGSLPRSLQLRDKVCSRSEGGGEAPATGGALDAKTIDSLATIVVDANAALKQEMEKAEEKGWIPYGKTLTSLQQKSADAVAEAKKALIYMCSGKDADLSLSNECKKQCKAIVDRCAEVYAEIEDLERTTNTGYVMYYKDYKGKTASIFHDMLCNAWDKLADVSDSRSKEYKRFENLYNEGHEAYLNMEAWNDSINNSLSSGEAYRANQEAINTQDILDKCGWKNIQDARALKRDVLTPMLAKAHDYRVASDKDMQVAEDSLSTANKFTHALGMKLYNKTLTTESEIRSSIGRLKQLKTNIKTIEPHRTAIEERETEMETMVKEAKQTETEILEMLIEEAPIYKEAFNIVTNIELTRDSIADIADGISEVFRSRGFSTLEGELTYYINKLDSMLDVVIGRDRVAALAIIAKLDSMNETRLDAYWNPYYEGADGRKGVDKMFTLYETIIRNRMAYNAGSAGDIQKCIDNCDRFIARLPELVKAESAAYSKTSNMSQEYLAALRAAGYSEEDELYKKASIKATAWQLTIQSDRTELNQDFILLDHIQSDKYKGADAVLSRFKSKYAGKTDLEEWFASVNDIKDEANKLKLDPTRVYEKLIPGIQAELIAMNGAKAVATTDANQLQQRTFLIYHTEDPESKCTSNRKYAEEYMQSYREGLIKVWKDGQPDYYRNRTFSGSPACYLNDIINECNDYNKVVADITDLIADFNTLSAMVADTLAKADSLVGVIPDKYNKYADLFKTYHKNIKAYYTGSPWNTIDDVCKTLNELKRVNDEVMLPMRTEAIVALNYIDEHGEPYLTDEERSQRDAYFADHYALGQYRDRIEQYFNLVSGKYVYKEGSYPAVAKQNLQNATDKWMPTLRSNYKQITSTDDPNDAGGKNLDKQLQIYKLSMDYRTSWKQVCDSMNNASAMADIILNNLWDAREAYDSLVAGKEQAAKLTQYSNMIKQIETASSSMAEYLPKMNTLLHEAEDMPYSTIYSTYLSPSLKRIKTYYRDSVNVLYNQANDLRYECYKAYNTMTYYWPYAETAYDEAVVLHNNNWHDTNLITKAQTAITKYENITKNYPLFTTNHSKIAAIKVQMTNLLNYVLSFGIPKAQLSTESVDNMMQEVLDYKNDMTIKYDTAVTKSAELEQWKTKAELYGGGVKKTRVVQ